MSDPSRFFQNFDMDDMLVTRSEDQTPPQRGGRNLLGRGRVRPQGPPPPITPVQGFTGLRYDTQYLSPTSAQRAIEGLRSSDFVVDRVQSHGFGQDRYFAFQLSAPTAVRLYTPAGGRSRIQCTCEDYRSIPSACVHIYWLFDGLHAVLMDQQTPAMHGSTEIEMTSRIGELYPLIEARQASLRGELNRVRGDALSSDSGESGGEEDRPSRKPDRTDTLCDILSSFDERYLPGEYRRDFVENARPLRSSDDILDRDSLSATIYRLAYWDETIYRRLRRVVPRDVCAIEYYNKQYKRARSSIKWLARYAQTGPQGGSLRRSVPERLRDMDVPKCARTLRYIVYQICADRDARTAIAPLGVSVVSRLAAILTEIIGEVLLYNKDIYQGSSWNRSRPPHEDARNRNLYAFLIGNPPFDNSLPPWMRDHFVIDRLQTFPADQWRHLFERLTTVKDGIDEMEADDMPASQEYAMRIEDMLRDYTATADEPSSSSAQMPRV